MKTDLEAMAVSIPDHFVMRLPMHCDDFIVKDSSYITIFASTQG